MLCRVSSCTFDTCNTLLFPDGISKEAIILTCSPLSQFAVTLVTSRPEDAFIDLIANSILGAIMLSIAVKNPVYILSSTVSAMLFISLSILSLKHLSNVFIFTVLSLTIIVLLEVTTAKNSVVSAFNDHCIFLSFTNSVANNHILIEVI